LAALNGTVLFQGMSIVKVLPDLSDTAYRYGTVTVYSYRSFCYVYY